MITRFATALILAASLVAACGCAPGSRRESAPTWAAGGAWDDVQSRIRRAEPGDVIDLPPGEWRDVTISFDASGTPQRPITLRAARAGKTILLGRSSIAIRGKNLVVAGVVFTRDTDAKSPPIVFTASSRDCQLSNCAITDFAAPFGDRFQYVLVGGSGHRIDRCLFTGKTNLGPVVAADGGQHVRVDHNLFRDIPYRPRNGREVIQVIGIGSNDEPLEAGGAYWLIEDNVFNRADGEGAEIISLKSNFNVVRNNTVRATRGAFTMRSGGGNTFEGNFIFGDGREGTGGLRVSGANARAVNNYIAGVSGIAIRLHAGEYIDHDISGKYEPLPRKESSSGRVARYLQLKDSAVANNLIVDTTGIDLEYGGGYGFGWPKNQIVMLPDALRLENNIFASHENPALPRTLKMNLADEKISRLPTDARPRAIIARDNFVFAAPADGKPPDEFGFRTDDPKMLATLGELFLPAIDSPAVTAGFDLMPFVQNRPLSAAEVGPTWLPR